MQQQKRSNNKAMGRDSGDADRARKNRFLQALAETRTIRGASGKTGISRRQHTDWRSQDPEYEDRFQDVMKGFADEVESELWRRGVDGVEEPIYRNGELVGCKIQRSDDLLLALLRLTRPELVSRSADGKARNANRRPLNLSALTTEELETLARFCFYGCFSSTLYVAVE